MTREEAEIYAKTMTYEDALHNLSQARAIPYRKATLIKVNELIKTLSQEPCEDAISRIKERIAYYENRKPKDGYDGVSYGKTEDGGGELKNPRTVEYERYSNRQIGLEEALEILQNHSVTQKLGKWIKSLDYIGNVKCSICQKEYDQDVLYDAKYCPNCSARMERENKE